MLQLMVEGTGYMWSETKVLFKIFPPTEVLTIVQFRDSPAEFSEPVEGEEGVELKVRYLIFPPLSEFESWLVHEVTWKQMFIRWE